ncbi:actin-like ATPase domain-containing protein [Hesseltinella vesiculosa]|uniref:Actin-like ATPase domain-containing protein n=1 Tax=Hesseltinella vesiculosa TaxID=101127 RepID=A0A1X2GJV5_9FUNG|nr:actin-like ATPase domain-containing protein [Hesseltinella vesiculosa]
MSISLREDNFVVIDVGSYQTKAGVGTHDTNKIPSTLVSMAEFNSPIKDNRIVSWDDFEATLQHVLFKELNIKKIRNEHPVLMSVPVHWTKQEHERLTQIAFENLNVPGLYIAPQPLLALYGCGSVSGLVVDVGHSNTDVNVIVDSLIQTSCSETIPIGGDHFNRYFLTLLKGDSGLVQQCEQAGVALDEAFAQHIREQPGVCHVAINHELQKTAATEQDESAVSSNMDEIADKEALPTDEDDEAPGDLPETIDVEYREHKFTIGAYRHRAYDPLFDPALVGADCLSLQEIMLMAANRCEPPEFRPKLWENVVLTGGCCLVQGLKRRVRSQVGALLPVSENPGDTQTTAIGFLRIPDYFSVLKKANYQHYSTWLGGEIVAKLIFIDAKNYVSKVDYNESGPSVCHTKSY